MNQSEASLEAGELQLVDGPLVAEGCSGDSTAWTSFFAQPHLPVEDTREEEKQEMLFTTMRQQRHCEQQDDPDVETFNTKRDRRPRGRGSKFICVKMLVDMFGPNVSQTDVIVLGIAAHGTKMWTKIRKTPAANQWSNQGHDGKTQTFLQLYLTMRMCSRTSHRLSVFVTDPMILMVCERRLDEI